MVKKLGLSPDFKSRHVAYGNVKVTKKQNFAAKFSIILKNAIVFGWRNISFQKYPQSFVRFGHLSSATKYQHLEGGRFI